MNKNTSNTSSLFHRPSYQPIVNNFTLPLLPQATITPEINSPGRNRNSGTGTKPPAVTIAVVIAEPVDEHAAPHLHAVAVPVLASVALLPPPLPPLTPTPPPGPPPTVDDMTSDTSSTIDSYEADLERALALSLLDVASPSLPFLPSLFPPSHAHLPSTHECPICFETSPLSATISCQNNNSSNVHRFCITCIRNVLKNGTECRDPSICDCTGFEFACPICRLDNDLLPLAIKAITKGDFDAAAIPPRSGPKHCTAATNYTNNGHTKTCVNCPTATPAVTESDSPLGLCCSEGHSLCVSCARDLVTFKAKCRDEECEGVGCKKNIRAEYTCPECEKGAVLNRRHIMVVMEGHW